MIREQITGFVPPRFLKTQAYRYLYSFGLVADAVVEQALQAMYARLPGIGTETADRLIAKDRGIRRGFAETHDNYVARVVQWLDSHKRRGSARELLRQLQGYTGAEQIRHVFVTQDVAVWRTIDQAGDITTVYTAPPNFNWDNNPDGLVARAWVIIYVNAALPWDRDGTWGDGSTWGDEGSTKTWGSTATVEQVKGVRDIVRGWKSATALYPSVIVCFDGSLFPPGGSPPLTPDGTWGQHSKLSGGVQVAARDDGAIYWDAVG